MELMCNGCKKSPDQIEEFIEVAKLEETTPDQFVLDEEGTLNHENGHFLCTECYIKAGMPSGPGGWHAP